MQPIQSKFSIQEHWQKRTRSSHLDVRILDPKKKFLWSWAIPKKKFPVGKEKVLAIRTVNHKLSYMYFQGKLDNGDHVNLFDVGKCIIVMYSQTVVILKFEGRKINGTYNFIRLGNTKNAWLITESKK